MRVLIVDESPDRASLLREGLELAGYEVAASLASPFELLSEMERIEPDVIVIDTDSPSRDVLEHLCVVSRDRPRPIVMFTSDHDPAIIREAMKAGVSAYVVDGLEPARVKPIVDVACARFDEFQRLRDELADANLKLSERKLVDRAKGILIKSRGLSEQDAYRALQRMAMDKGKRIGEIAQSVIDLSSFIG